ncbi:hypothetical protein PO124_27495 [Bacillus licheniformis]|nr:hypothetical protein [Bacillus licheniformis]
MSASPCLPLCRLTRTQRNRLKKMAERDLIIAGYLFIKAEPSPETNSLSSRAKQLRRRSKRALQTRHRQYNGD